MSEAGIRTHALPMYDVELNPLHCLLPDQCFALPAGFTLTLVLLHSCGEILRHNRCFSISSDNGDYAPCALQRSTTLGWLKRLQ